MDGLAEVETYTAVLARNFLDVGEKVFQAAIEVGKKLRVTYVQLVT